MNENKKISIRFKNLDDYTFELLENGNQGDYFSLNDIFNRDSLLVNQIKAKLDEYNASQKKKLIEEMKVSIINQFKNEVDGDYYKLFEENKNLKRNKDELAKDYETKLEVRLAKEKVTANEIMQKFKDEIIVLKQDKKNLLVEKQNFENKFQFDPNGIYQKLKQDFNKLDKEYQMFKKDQELEKSNLEKTIDLEKQKAIFDFKNSESGEYKKLEEECAFLKERLNFANNASSKFQGQELEKFIDDEWRGNALSLNPTCDWKKEYTEKNFRADFLLDINNLNQELICRVVIEAKNQKEGSKNKNSAHFKKLLNYKETFAADYAILVSQLELEKKFQFQIEYIDNQQIFIVRPGFLITLLNVIHCLAQKYIKINAENKELDEKSQIFNRFDAFKEDIFETLDRMSKHLDSISNEKDKIIKASEGISKSVDKSKKIIESTIINKIKNFKIEKVLSKLDN